MRRIFIAVWIMMAGVSFAQTQVEVLLRAYTTLTKPHLPPSDPNRLAEAVVRALPRSATPEPAFTSNAEADSRLLEQYARAAFSQQKRGDKHLWEAVRATITATEDLHTMLISPAQSKAAGAFLSGLPSVNFGAAIGYLPDGRRLVIDVDPGRLLSSWIAERFSAAEFTAYALQQNKSALILGSPTGGGLSVPEDLELVDGIVLHYSGRAVVGPACHCIPACGRVIPEIVLPSERPTNWRPAWIGCSARL